MRCRLGVWLTPLVANGPRISKLLTFSTRHPRVAHCLQSAVAIGTLPGLPLMFCIEHRPQLARWAAAVGVAAALMSSVLATLNWLIVVPI